jgi:hypothetical protein
MGAGSTQNVNLSFGNSGSLTWESNGANEVNISYHWRTGACPGNGTAVWDGIRTSLPGNVASGGAVSNRPTQVRAPASAGTYCLQFDLVREGVTWFSTQNAATRTKTVTITGGSTSVTWLGDNAPSSMDANDTVSVNLSFRNDGSVSWPSGGANPVRVSYHWRSGACPGTTTTVWDGIRTNLTGNVAAGANVTNLASSVKAPSSPGTYCLVFDLVQEGVTWFSTQGGSVRTKTVTVD